MGLELRSVYGIMVDVLTVVAVDGCPGAGNGSYTKSLAVLSTIQSKINEIDQ